MNECITASRCESVRTCPFDSIQCAFFFSCPAELRKRLFADSSVTPNTWLRTNEGGIKTFDCLRKEVGDVLRFVCMHKYVCVQVLLCDLFHLTPHTSPLPPYLFYSLTPAMSPNVLYFHSSTVFFSQHFSFYFSISLPCVHFLSETFSKWQIFTSKLSSLLDWFSYSFA